MYSSHFSSTDTSTPSDIRALDVDVEALGSERDDEMSFLLQLFRPHLLFGFFHSFKWQIHFSLFKRQRLIIQRGDTPVLMRSEGAGLFSLFRKRVKPWRQILAVNH